MGIGQFLAAFARDDLVHLVLLLVAVDFILGVGAALKRGDFAFSRVAGFLKDDILGKVFPWFVLYAADKASGSADIAGPIDFGTVAALAFAGVTLALAGSIVASLNDFGLNMPDALARGEHTPAVVTYDDQNDAVHNHDGGVA